MAKGPNYCTNSTFLNRSVLNKVEYTRAVQKAASHVVGQIEARMAGCFLDSSYGVLLLMLI